MTENYSALAAETPYKSYIKRCLGKLYLTVLDPFSGDERGVLLFGDPTKKPESCIYDVFTEKEDVFLRRKNKRHFETGDLVAYVRQDYVLTEEERLNQMTEEDFAKLLNKPFLAIQNTVNKFTSVTPLAVMLEVAHSENKSEKITKVIEAKIAELQEKEYAQFRATKEDKE